MPRVQPPQLATVYTSSLALFACTLHADVAHRAHKASKNLPEIARLARDFVPGTRASCRVRAGIALLG